MRDHSLDKWLCKLAHARRRRTEFPKIADLFRPLAALEIAPEMVLDRRFACSPPFAHKLLPKFRHSTGDFRRRARALGAAINCILKTARACLTLVIETEHHIDHWNTIINRNALKRISHGMAEIFRVVCFSAHDYAASDNRIGFFLSRQLAHHHRNFERSRHVVNRDCSSGHKLMQFFGSMINQALYVWRVKPARDDLECAFALLNSRAPRRVGRHSFNPQSSICNHSRCPSFVFFVSRYFALCGLASLRMGTCSTISRP